MFKVGVDMLILVSGQVPASHILQWGACGSPVLGADRGILRAGPRGN